MRKLIATLAGLGLVLALGSAAHATQASCSVSPNPVSVNQGYVVSAQGLPTSTSSQPTINLFVTDSTGTIGYPLGQTPDGTFNLSESSSVTGTTTYRFTGKTHGSQTPDEPWGTGTSIYAVCSVQVN